MGELRVNTNLECKANLSVKSIQLNQPKEMPMIQDKNTVNAKAALKMTAQVNVKLSILRRLYVTSSLIGFYMLASVSIPNSFKARTNLRAFFSY